MGYDRREVNCPSVPSLFKTSVFYMALSESAMVLSIVKGSTNWFDRANRPRIGSFWQSCLRLCQGVFIMHGRVFVELLFVLSVCQLIHDAWTPIRYRSPCMMTHDGLDVICSIFFSSNLPPFTRAMMRDKQGQSPSLSRHIHDVFVFVVMMYLIVILSYLHTCIQTNK